MLKKLTLRTTLGCLVWVLLGFVTELSAGERPNIVFLLTDDQATYSLGCYGNPDVVTPQLDRLANDGVIFDRHYVTTAICMASRSSIMTGMYEYKTGCNFTTNEIMPVSMWEKSYPILLRKEGYLTAFAGKFGFEIEGRGWGEKEFDVYGGSPEQTEYQTKANKSMARYAAQYPHATRAYGAFGQDVIREAVQKNKPFCLSISFKAPHRPSEPDPLFNEIYQGKKFTKPANFGREFSDYMSLQSKQGRQYKRFQEWKYDKDYDGVMAKYHQLVYGVDVAVGMIRAELERQGVADKTVIIFTSDNGYICGSHGYASKVLPMEEASRVPLIIYDPRSPATGRKLRCGALTGNIDFAPTILALAGIPIPSNMDGVNLLPLVNDPSKDVRDQMVLMNVWGETATTCFTAVTKDWKYTYWWYSDKNMKPAEDLFCLANDPLELKQLAKNPEYGEQLKSMRAIYDEELLKWKSRAVKDYQPYAILFDRNIPAAEKQEGSKSVKTKKDTHGGE